MPDISALTTARPHEPLHVITASLQGRPLQDGVGTPQAATPWSRDDRNPLELSRLSRKLHATHAQIIDRMVSQPEGAETIIWSAGNVRINGRDLTMQMTDSVILYGLLRKDKRFTKSKLKYFDGDRHDWKVVFVRTRETSPGFPDEHYITEVSEASSRHDEDSMYLKRT